MKRGRHDRFVWKNSRHEVDDDELVPWLADSALPEVPVRPLWAALLPVGPLEEEEGKERPSAGNGSSKARLLRCTTTGLRALVIRVWGRTTPLRSTRVSPTIGRARRQFGRMQKVARRIVRREGAIFCCGLRGCWSGGGWRGLAGIRWDLLALFNVLGRMAGHEYLHQKTIQRVLLRHITTKRPAVTRG